MVTAFAVAAFGFGSRAGVNSGRHDSGALPTQAPLVLKPLDVEIELGPLTDAQLTRLREILEIDLSVPTGTPWRLVSHEEAGRLVGWPVLTHRTYGEDIDVRNGSTSWTVVTNEGYFSLDQTPAGSSSLFEHDESEPRIKRRIGAFSVTFYWGLGSGVEARFATGARTAGGIPIVAAVEGPDIEAVAMLISELTFRDGD